LGNIGILITHSQDAAIQNKSLCLSIHDIAVLQALGFSHEGGLMAIWVEFLPLAVLREVSRVEPLQAVVLEGGHNDILSHLQTVEEIVEILVFRGLVGNLVRRHSTQGAVEVIDGFDKVLSEALDSKGLGRIDVTAGTLLKIAEIGNGAEVFILIVRKVG
jgi:hypothetical protein